MTKRKKSQSNLKQKPLETIGRQKETEWDTPMGEHGKIGIFKKTQSENWV